MLRGVEWTYVFGAAVFDFFTRPCAMVRDLRLREEDGLVKFLRRVKRKVSRQWRLGVKRVLSTLILHFHLNHCKSRKEPIVTCEVIP